jgi:small subunit ribosomal protein S1
MSDTDKPADPAQAPAPEQPEAQKRPPSGPGPRLRPERERRQRPGGKVPSLEQEQTYGGGQKIDAFDEEMERQLQEAMGGLSEKELYGEPQHGRPRQGGGGPQKGKVFRIHGQDVFVELPGGRTQGVLPLEQFPEGPPKVGQEVEVHIEGHHPDGVLLLTRQGQAVEADWSSVAVGQIVEARVTATNKGGLAVDVNGIRGFMPISQVDLYRVEEPEQYVNQRLRCLVAEVNREERNLVVSRRALLEKEREEARDKLWAELEEGQVREGVVRSVREFGAFVDLGGVDGLIHVSELSWTRVKDPGEVVQPGQRVKVVVLKIDLEKRKVGLGMRQLTASPWDAAGLNYPSGAVVQGKVTRLAEFGAFVELEPGVEGLVHVSELAPQRVRKPADVVKVGQSVQVKVLNSDPANRRLSLSLKAVAVQEAEAAAAAAAAAEEEAAAEPVKPRRPRTTPLRGGVGSREVPPVAGAEEEEGE